MKISIHTVAKDAIRLDFHLEHMLRHHAPFADEIIVMEGMSKDSTYDRIKDIDPKIKIIRSEWNATDSYRDFVERGRAECTGDWCIKLDADEFLPEWEWDRLREHLASTTHTFVPIRLLNFYGNYKVVQSDSRQLSWPEFKWCIHPNDPDIHFWGDASNAAFADQPKDFGRDPVYFEVHHFGAVRDAKRLREKWRTQAIRNQKHTGYYRDKKKIRRLPSWVYNLFPHDWLDKDMTRGLAYYAGPHMDIVKNDPAEFVRDEFKALRATEGCYRCQQKAKEPPR